MHSLASHWIDDILLASPVARGLGISVEAAQADRIVARLPYSDGVTTTPGVIHGGVIATLIDTAGAMASASGLAPGDGATGGATSHLTVTYLAPAGSELTATATVVHRTRSATVTNVHVHDAQGRPVATGQVSSRIFRRPSAGVPEGAETEKRTGAGTG
ncbi:PaaI family thioesterase [Gordonia caeni]|uniref:Hotdog fold thioesterase n=1 Tax=Gordonia caeni TaxID=1007097 RepID=A0ABP7NZF7_9ACTN